MQYALLIATAAERWPRNGEPASACTVKPHRPSDLGRWFADQMLAQPGWLGTERGVSASRA